MVKSIKENLAKMKKTSAKISTLISDIENTPEHLLQYDYNRQTDALYNCIIELYSQLGVYHRQASGLYSISKKFPTTASKFTEIQEIRGDYIRIKMPILYRKNKEDSVLVDDLDMAFFNVLKSGVDIPVIDKKEISFTFYYNSNTERSLIRDNDNYSIKGVINTIVRYLQSTDSGDTTWLSLKTAIMDDTQNHTIIEIKKRD